MIGYKKKFDRAVGEVRLFSRLKSYIKPNKLFFDLSPQIVKPKRQSYYADYHKFLSIFLGSVVCINTKLQIILSNFLFSGRGYYPFNTANYNFCFFIHSSNVRLL